MVPHPEYPAVPEYPTPSHGGPYAELLETTKANFLEVIEKGSEYWEGESRNPIGDAIAESLAVSRRRARRTRWRRARKAHPP